MRQEADREVLSGNSDVKSALFNDVSICNTLIFKWVNDIQPECQIASDNGISYVQLRIIEIA
jgi:hypothetical protein